MKVEVIHYKMAYSTPARLFGEPGIRSGRTCPGRW
jgi:hypothetical protein